MFRGSVEFDEGGRPHLHFNYAPGNGGDPEGPNWGDTVEDWLAGVYAEMPFTLAEVEAATVEQRELEVPEAYR